MIRAARWRFGSHGIAENYWNLHAQDPSTWSQEIDLRPSVEQF
jgi:hypothetical protein